MFAVLDIVEQGVEGVVVDALRLHHRPRQRQRRIVAGHGVAIGPQFDPERFGLAQPQGRVVVADVPLVAGEEDRFGADARKAGIVPDLRRGGQQRRIVEQPAIQQPGDPHGHERLVRSPQGRRRPGQHDAPRQRPQRGHGGRKRQPGHQVLEFGTARAGPEIHAQPARGRIQGTGGRPFDLAEGRHGDPRAAVMAEDAGTRSDPGGRRGDIRFGLIRRRLLPNRSRQGARRAGRRRGAALRRRSGKLRPDRAGRAQDCAAGQQTGDQQR